MPYLLFFQNHEIIGLASAVFDKVYTVSSITHLRMIVTICHLGGKIITWAACLKLPQCELFSIVTLPSPLLIYNQNFSVKNTLACNHNNGYTDSTTVIAGGNTF